MLEKYSSNIKFIYEYFGEKNQIDKLKEEMYELIEEIDNYQLRGKKKENFIAEIADVQIMLDQIIEFYLTEKEREDLLNKVDFKVRRTLERIKDKLVAEMHNTE